MVTALDGQQSINYLKYFMSVCLTKLLSTSSLNAEIYFNNSINHATCSLFGDLDFSTSDGDSWDNITKACFSGLQSSVQILINTEN